MSKPLKVLKILWNHSVSKFLSDDLTNNFATMTSLQKNMWPKYLDMDAKSCAGILRKLGKKTLKLEFFSNPSLSYNLSQNYFLYHLPINIWHLLKVKNIKISFGIQQEKLIFHFVWFCLHFYFPSNSSLFGKKSRQIALVKRELG